MRWTELATCASALCVLLGVAVVRAEPERDAQGYGASAKVKRPVAARNEEDATAAATTVDLTRRPLALESLRDVMPEVPGTLAIAQGGYGSFSSVSLRGTDLGQTVWLLGDVPLNGPETGAFDMSLLPLPQLSQLEVYRGGAPVWYGQGSIGGVVRIVPREGRGTGASAQLGVGSFGTLELRASSYVGSSRASLYTGIQTTHANNDYPYWDPQGPGQSHGPSRPLDNADVTDGAGVMHARIAAAGGHVDVITYGLERVGGVSGAAGQTINAHHTHRTLDRGLFAVAYTREGKLAYARRYRLQFVTSAQDQQSTLDDPYQELGFGGALATRQSYVRGTMRAAGTLQLLRFLDTTLVSTYAGDRFDSHDALAPLLTGPSTRTAGAVSGELRLFGRLLGFRSELRGSVRSEWDRTTLQVVQLSRLGEQRKDQQAGTYRLAFSTEPLVGLNLRASAGTGRRLPTITELFGDGGTMRPNTLLVPEQGAYADAGFVITQAFGSTCVVVEANAFASRVTDKIAYVTTGQFSSVARNLGKADVQGVELGGELEYRDALRLVGASTFMRSQTDVGDQTQLPRQPKLRLYARAEASAHFRSALNRITAYSMVDHVSTAYLDASNEWLRQPLTHVGLGATLGFFQNRFELGARANDIFDVRGQDYQRYPLPGRSFSMIFSLKEKSP